ncbi:MAG: sulfurtransferase TusA family protein [Candidatus Accumulibacter sp.]|jgi:tRNA 2-thiouridine synthesizing protein A|nr:sulfurtransferase TusA family protein [Accumulibacter sp.]
MEFPAEKREAAPFDRELDAKGMYCPLPILKTKKALFEMDSGQVLRVLATDPGTAGDFEAFARQTGNALISSFKNDDGVFVFHFRRK